MGEEPVLDEAARRRKRTCAYLSMWAVDADVTALPVLIESAATVRKPLDVVGRAKAMCLCALKGQGLSQREVFAFADAYEVWDHLTLSENDFVLEPDPPHADLVQHAWLSEGLWVLEWSLGLIRLLAFPDNSVDVAEATRVCIEGLCTPLNPPDPPSLRPAKDLLDAADVAFAFEGISLVARAQGVPLPGNIHPGIVFERHNAFAWLVRGG